MSKLSDLKIYTLPSFHYSKVLRVASYEFRVTSSQCLNNVDLFVIKFFNLELFLLNYSPHLQLQTFFHLPIIPLFHSSISYRSIPMPKKKKPRETGAFNKIKKCYLFFFFSICDLYLFINLSTRPVLSTSFILPV